MVQTYPKQVKRQNKAEKGLKLPKYTFLSRHKNPEYEGGVKRLPFESCLITTKGSKIANEIWVKTRPKWYTNLMGYEIDPETGEATPKEIYQSDDFKCSNGKKIKSLDKFCAFYQPLYKKRNVTLFFLTFTRANYARLPWVYMVKIILQYFKRAGLNVRGHIWTAEISDKLHWHYHMCIATDRVNWKLSGVPKELKFENLWGQRTEIDFVKKNVRHYMAKYFAKCDFRIIGKRSYGISRKLM